MELDYLGPHAYFLTICTDRRHRAFDDDPFASEATSKLLSCASKYGFALPAYSFMPDHVHIVAEGQRDDSALKTLMRSWTTRTGHAWRQRYASRLWQPGYYDHVLREGDPILGVARYVVLNPVRAGLVMNAGDHKLTGSTQYTIPQILEAADDWRPSW